MKPPSGLVMLRVTVRSGEVYGSASSMMVPVAAASSSVAFVGLDNVSVKVSSSSASASSNVCTLTVCDVVPAANTSASHWLS